MSGPAPSSSLQQIINEALQLHRQGRIAEAETLYAKGLLLAPTHPDVLFLYGTLLHQSGRDNEAAGLLQQAVQARPTDANLHAALATVYFRMQDWEAALVEARAAISLNRGHFDAQFALACTLEKLGRTAEAMQAYRNAAAIRPTPPCFQNLGLLLLNNGQTEAALVEFQTAVKHDPQSAEAWCNQGDAELALRALPEAINSYQRCLSLNPGNGRAQVNLCRAFSLARRLDEAVAVGRQAIAMDPMSVTAYQHTADALWEMGQVQAAKSLRQKALELQPESAGLHSRLVMDRCYELPADPKILLQLARTWDDRHAKAITPATSLQKGGRGSDGRLNIGYVSADFRNHPVGHFMIPIIERHDRGRFKIHCFSNVRQWHRATDWFRSACDRWHDLSPLNDADAAELIRQQGIDVLVDLSLHSDGNRLGVFARKPAPVQLSYLAYCGTSGLGAMDYLLCDRHLIPPGSEADFTETPLRLPRTYWCYRVNAGTPPVGPLPAESNGFITFGSLNHPAKLSPEILAIWARVLKAVPHSRLILHAPDCSARAMFAGVFTSAGIAAERIQFHDRVSLGQYFKLQTEIDIALDPFPFAGGTTSCDALWMGAPLITLAGKTAVSRGGSSILNAVGLPEFIAETPEQYIELATGLAENLSRLAALRKSMRDRMLASPLMDEKGFVNDLETIYQQAWEKRNSEGA